MTCWPCGSGSCRGQGELGAVVPVVPGRPHQQVGPTHPRQEVGIPARGHAHSSLQTHLGCPIGPTHQPLLVAVHPPPDRLKATASPPAALAA